MLARGFPLTRYVAQVFGTSLDVLKGRQMPSHMSGREVNLVSWSSSIGTQLTHAVGAAWAAKIRGEDCVAVAFCGDGATSTADFHAAMNFAAVFRLPVVIVCQNNHWAISVPAARQTGAATFAIKAEAYAIEHARVDGNDVIATYAVVSSAIERARRGGGPSFLECVTYRVDGHSSSDDPSRYRSEEEVASWRARDPIASLARHLRQRGLLDDASDASLTSAIDADIQRAVAEAEAAPLPDRATLFEDVYSQPPWHLQEQREELLRFAPAAQPN
jgi:pyruvate dehydrogenase E1 component alpha subunit/2-oxoisovalerate dehydrogenase E1 component alpha subunit